MAYKPKTIKDFFGYNIYRTKLAWYGASANMKATIVLAAIIFGFLTGLFLLAMFPKVMMALFLTLLLSAFIYLLWLMIRSCIDD